MPRAVLNLERLWSLLPPSTTRASVEEAMWRSKAEIVEWTDGALTVEATPDRLDLLTEGGVGLALQGALRSAVGLPSPTAGSSRGVSSGSLRSDPSVAPLRPFVLGVVVVAPDGASLDLGLLDEAIRYQELLHATIGGDRRMASLGIYPWERLRAPIDYSLEPLTSVRFTPLDGEAPLSGDEFFASHPMAARYGALGRSRDRCLVLRDAAGTILSVPPILNSREAGEARGGERSLLLESTGVLRPRVEDSLGLFLVPFIARGWTAYPIPVDSGSAPGLDRSPVDTRPLYLAPEQVAAVGGLSVLPSEVEGYLRAARLDVVAEGTGWHVQAPPWRPDLLSDVDLVEEIVVARGVGPDDGVAPPSPVRGRRRGESRFRDRVAELLLGGGFALLHTPVLVSTRSVRRTGRELASVRLSHPVSEEFAFVRDALQVSVLDVLGRNVRHGYPQRIAEVGPVIVRDANSDSGTATRVHAAGAVAGERTGFDLGASVVDYLLRAFEANGVRESAELPGTIPGRSARVRIAGDTVAELGEVHPRVLTELRVPVPAVWFELDLTTLGPLVRRAEDV